jgi:hypothetical protein
MDLTSLTLGAAAAATSVAGFATDPVEPGATQADKVSTIAACSIQRSKAPSFAESAQALRLATPSASYVRDEWMNVPSCQA